MKQMTQEEKELLIKDLCARLPYGVVYHRNDGANIKLNAIDVERGLLNYADDIDKRECKPYLRPMSSMTEEEKQQSRWYQCDAKSDDFILYMNRYVEWLDSHYFDWRTDGNGKTMIENGLALEAKEGMYNN